MYLMPSANSSCRARVAVRLAQLREPALGKARHALVDVHLHAGLDLLVLEHLAQRAAVAAADDHVRAWRAGAVNSAGVAHHFVIEEIVARGEHHAAVDHHELAEVRGVVDLYGLERRLLGVQLLLDAEGDGRARGRVRLGEPVLIETHGDAEPQNEPAIVTGACGLCLGRPYNTRPFLKPHGRDAMSDWTIERARQTYSRAALERWATSTWARTAASWCAPRVPTAPRSRSRTWWTRPERRGLKLPLLMRFSDVLGHKLGRLQDAFARAMAEHDYQGAYTAIYPIKVNQHQSVAGELVARGTAGFGLEAGSKPRAHGGAGVVAPGRRRPSATATRIAST
jgi:hypothetical protein